MTLEQAKTKLTTEQISELEARGRAWGEQEATLWRDVQSSSMPEWSMWSYCGDLSAYNDEETRDAADLVLDCAARAAWDAAGTAVARNEMQHRIDCAYDCDCPDLATRLEAELAAMPAESTPASNTTWADPLADTAAIFGVSK